MNARPPLLAGLPKAVLTAILSLQLSLPAVKAGQPQVNAGVLLNGTNTLDGSHSVIDGGASTGFFVNSGTLTIDNATLSNFRTVGGAGSGGGAAMGGALFINTGATVTLNNVSFTSNTAKGGQGGAGSVGGSLNNLFNSGSSVGQATSGYTPTFTNYTDINGTLGTKGSNAGINLNGIGGMGGNGGAGGNGGDRSESLILSVTAATADVIDLGVEIAAASANPFTANVAIGLAPKVISAGLNLGNSIAALAYFDKSLSDGQIGLGGAGGVGGNGGAGGFGYGGGQGGDGGDGGSGGKNWSGSLFKGGAAGGDGGDGGLGGLGGFGAGGGQGGDGGIGGGGAGFDASAGSPAVAAVYETVIIPAVYSKGYYLDGDNNPATPATWVELEGNLKTSPDSYSFDHDSNPATPDVTVQGKQTSEEKSVQYLKTPAQEAVAASQGGSRPNGASGAGGTGGAGGFGGGTGASGFSAGSLIQGGNGGNGFGGAIFVRSGATLIITGDAVFDGNGVRGGDGQTDSASVLAGSSGIGVGTDLFMMKGSTVILDPGAGHTITFNGDAYGTSIADDSASSLIPSGGASPITSGSGAGITIKSGLVQFNGTNLYSGVTRIEGGTLQAQDGDGIYWDSAIHFAGTTASNAVLMMNGTFSRFTGTQSNRVQWTGSGGFAAVDGELDVRLNNGAALTWGSGGFVGLADSLIFGSATATDHVNVLNAINLSGGERTILVTANGDDTDHVVMKGILSNGSLTVGDATHQGTVVLAASNTYTGLTKVAGGTLATSGNNRIADASTVEVASGARFLLGGNETVAGITGAGTVELGNSYTLTTNVTANATFGGVLAGSGTLVKDGAAKLTLSGVSTHTGTIDLKTGSLDIMGSVESAAVNVAAGTNLGVSNGGLGTSTVLTNSGTADLGTVNDTIASLINTGTLNGSSTLTATTYDLNDGSIINANLGAGTVNTAGNVTLNGSSAAGNVNVALGSTLNLQAAERLNDDASVDVKGTLNLNGGSEKVGAISGDGTIDVKTNTLTSDAATDSTFAGTIQGTGGFTKEGTGKLTLSSNNTYTGATTVAEGTLANTGDNIADTSSLEVQSGATFRLGGDETIADISGAGSIELQTHKLTPHVGTDSTFAGVLSGTGTLTKLGAAKLTLSGVGTTTGTLNLNAGSIDLTGSIDSGTVNIAAGTSLSSNNGGLSASANVTNSGTLDIGSVNDTIATLLNIGTVNGSAILTAATYNLNNGSVINAHLGAGTLNTTGAVTYNGTSAAETVNVGIGSTLNLQSAERLLNSSDVTINGTLNLNGGSETIGTVAGSGTIDVKTHTLITNATSDTAFSGVIAGSGGLTKNGTGKLTLSGANTFTGDLLINAGAIDLTGSAASNNVTVIAGATLDSTNGGLASTAVVTNAGTLNVGAVNDTITTLHSTGAVNGTGTLTAGTYNLNNGTVLNAHLGAGVLNTTGTVTLNGTSAAQTVNVAIGSVLNLAAAELLLNTATVTVNGTLNLNGGDETIDTLLGSGTVNTNAYHLYVTNGGSFKGTLNATSADLNTGNGGGGLTLDGGTTTTQSTTVDNNLTITNGGTLNSSIITLSNGSVLDLSGGGTINFTNLTTQSHQGGLINIGGTDFIIPAGSTLSGFISFVGSGNVIINGTLSPGFSPGVVDLTGTGLSPELGSGALFEAELAGTGGVGTVDFDQMQIATGANLSIDGTLTVASYGAFLPAQGDSFQIISGPGGSIPINHITGFFATVNFDADGLLLGAAPVSNAAVIFDVNTGLLTATGLNAPGSTFADLGTTGNQRAAAGAIFAAATAGHANQIDSDTTTTVAGQLALQIVDAAGGAAADLARYVPDYYGSLSDYAFMGNQVLIRSIQDRVSPMSYIPAQVGEDCLNEEPAHMSVFLGYSNTNLTTADDADISRNDYYTGINLLASEDVVLGLAGSMSEGSISARLGSAESEGFGGMIFGRLNIVKSFTFFGSFGYYSQDFDLTRQTVNGTVTGSTDASSYVGFLGVQYKGWRVGDVSIAPRVSFTYSNTSVGGFTESGAIDALHIGGYSATQFMGEAGLSALWTTEVAGRPLNVELAASVQQMFTDSKDAMNVNVAAVPAMAYPVNFASNSSTQAVIRANLSYAIARLVNLYSGYEGHFGGRTAHYIKGGLRINF